MTDEALLSELCAICHLNRPKYKCPLCTTQTCSLACVKRHKLWSQCSGARNPAPYRKRHDLAKPSSVDQDYNFITSVERKIGLAGDLTQERGISLDTNPRKRFKGEARRDAEIQQAGAIVFKAPCGMSRALQNKTKWDYRLKCLLWTVEWILEDGTKVFARCQDRRTIQDAFTSAVGTRKTQSAQRSASKTIIATPDLSSESVSNPPKDVTNSESSEHVVSDPNAQLNFYLHRPNLPSGVRCVIPIEPDRTLKEAIRGKVLNEFPTIFALSLPGQKLQKPFITEEEYLNQDGNESLKATSESLMSRDPAGDPADNPNQELSGLDARPALDEEKLIEVLRKDLAT